MIYRFQTGNVPNKRGSCQATKNNDGMASLELLPQRKASALRIHDRDIRNQAASLRHVFITPAPAVAPLPHGNGMGNNRYEK